MRDRCNNRKNAWWPSYGGRGIMVCARWDSFELFLADMGRKPSMRHTIDRFPNNDGDYEPTNCRWATPSEQMENTRRSIPAHLVSIAASNGVGRAALRNRLQMGWDEGRACSQPLGTRHDSAEDRVLRRLRAGMTESRDLGGHSVLLRKLIARRVIERVGRGSYRLIAERSPT